MARPFLVLIVAFAVSACAHVAEDFGDGSDEGFNHNPGGAMSRWAQRLSADGTIPEGNVERMIEERELNMRTHMDVPGMLQGWQWLGPGNIGGRLRSIVIDPTNPSIMYVGAAGGSIWKTTDGGANWGPLDNFPNVMPIGCLAMDPADPKTIFAGTGEGVFDSVHGTSILAAPRGAGIWVTNDAGATWKQLPSTTGSSWYFVNRIAFSPNSSRVLLAATSTGIWHTVDGGQTWSRRATTNTFDVHFHPTNPNLAVAGGRDSQAMYSTDGGVTWQFASGISSPQRVELEYAKSSPSTVYAAVSSAGRILIYRSTDGGQTYARRTQGNGIQTWSRYNNTLWVDPTNPSNLYIGGVNLYRSNDGGTTYGSAGSGVHADQHYMIEHPAFDGVNNRTAFVASDGGIARTTNVNAGSVSWTALNNTMGCTQFYGAAINPETGVIVGGTQDNGTMYYRGGINTWGKTFGGDGGFAASDPFDPNYFYGEIQNLRIFRSTNGGQSASYIDAGINESRPNFIPPFILDPNNNQRILACGAQLWVSDNCKDATPTWRSIKPAINCQDSPGGPGRAHFAVDPPCNISAVAVAHGRSEIIWVGHNSGHLYVTTNGTSQTPTWTRVDTNSPGLPNRWISRITPDHWDSNRVYVTVMGYTPDNVWLTEDAGQSWRRITGSGASALPSAPATSVAVHRIFPGWLFVGTDVGLYCSQDDGATWSTSDDGAGDAPVEELVWKNQRTLMVVTHGRGIYTAESGDAAAMTTAGTGCGVKSAPVLTSSIPYAGVNLALALRNASPSAPVFLVAAAGNATPTNIGNGCVMQVNPAGAFAVPLGATDATGQWGIEIDMGRSPRLLGAVYTLQCFIAVQGGPALGQGEVSNGVQLSFGL